MGTFSYTSSTSLIAATAKHEQRLIFHIVLWKWKIIFCKILFFSKLSRHGTEWIFSLLWPWNYLMQEKCWKPIWTRLPSELHTASPTHQIGIGLKDNKIENAGEWGEWAWWQLKYVFAIWILPNKHAKNAQGINDNIMRWWHDAMATGLLGNLT